MSTDQANPPGLASNLRFCARCNRPIADEPSDLCDHCEPRTPQPAIAHAHLKPFAAVTWTLIAINIPAGIIANALAHQHVPFGAALGPSVIAGQWWFLLTALFIHSTLSHLLGNLIVLWFFGKRLEAMLGKWPFLGLFLVSGVAGNLVMLCWYPEDFVIGASAGVFGVMGAVAAIYACRFRSLTRRQWIKLGLVIVLIVWGLFADRLDPAIGHLAHIGGLITGVVLGPLLAFLPADRRVFRRWVFVGATIVLIADGVYTRIRDAYVVHLHLAMRALDAGDDDAAARELRVARALNPHSRLADYVARQLAERDAVGLPKANAN